MIRQRALLDDPEQFLSMIVKGVIPYVENNYKIDSKDRTFCGASFGGYFMLYSLFQSDGLTQDIFKNYILASPTFWKSTQGSYLYDFENEYYAGTQQLPAHVYLTVGGLEDEEEFQKPIIEFIEMLESRNYGGFQLNYKVYEKNPHYTVWVPTLLDGLKMYLKE